MILVKWLYRALYDVIEFAIQKNDANLSSFVQFKNKMALYRVP